MRITKRGFNRAYRAGRAPGVSGGRHHRLLTAWFGGLVVAGLVVLGGLWSPLDAHGAFGTAAPLNQADVPPPVIGPDGEQVHSLYLSRLATGSTATPADGGAALRAALERWGNLPVIIRLDVSGDDISSAADAEPDPPAAPWDAPHLAAITGIDAAQLAEAQQAVLAALAGFRLDNIKVYEATPVLALTLYDAEALTALENDPWVLEIQEDRLDLPLLNESVFLIGAEYTASLFGGGAGQTVAILDTGVDRFHQALAGKVLGGACYSTTNTGQGISSFCPGGASESTTLASGQACPAFVSGCDHGTIVGGIAAAVAPQASLVSIQVFSRVTDGGANTRCADANRTSPCVLSYVSDQIKALERVRALRNNYSFAAVNMSLGGGAFTAACTTDTRRSIIAELRNMWGISVVGGAGNDGYRNAMIAPACIPEVFSVAASDKNNVLADYSNIASFTNVIAPGSDIYGPVHAPNYDTKNGTSLATPHVAGALAVLRGVAPNRSAAQYEGALINTGILIQDTRPANIGISRPRIQVWSAFCNLTTCDADDFRFVSLNQTVNGSINPAGDRDYYYVQGNVGQRLTIAMDRTSGTLNPYLELLAPGGLRVAFNNDGGAGTNALINNVLLPQTGMYVIVARNVTGTGNYTLRTSTQPATLNPVPRITRLSPTSATGTPFGSDFWVAIYGENFMPDSTVYWNNQLRAKFYSNPGLIYIRVRGSDIGLFPSLPRLSFVHVTNPGPGGGNSNSYPFSINVPFLGESAMLTPPTETTIETGVQTSVAISWTAPITATTWRSMQNMDLRIRNERNEVAAWVRIVEQPGENSFYRLLNATENASDADVTPVVLEGAPGEARTLVISDTVTLHLEQSEFFGSGLTAIMTPSLTFGPNAVGTWNVEFRVDRKFDPEDDEPEEGEELELVQDDDILGVIHIVPAGCPVAVGSVEIDGPTTGLTGSTATYTATVAPLTATAPITYTWVPTPTQGIGTSTATYSWTTPGPQPVSVFVENCGGFGGGLREVAVATQLETDLAISKDAPAAIVPGELLTYTLDVINTGAITATDLVITDVVPSGLLVSGQIVTEPVTLTWQIDELGPYGASTQVAYSATVPLDATGTITNQTYRVSATGGYTATGAPVTTQVVQALAPLDNTVSGTLYTGPTAPESPLVLEVPAGAVFEPIILTLTQLRELPAEPPPGTNWTGLGFVLGAVRNGQLTTDLQLSEMISATLRGVSTQAQGQPGTAPVTLSQAEVTSLYHWTGSEWRDDTLVCADADPPAAEICTLDGAAMGTYALLTSAADSPQSFTLTVDVVGEGIVTTQPDLEQYPESTVVTLTATAATGWTFSDWRGGVESTDNPLTITLNGDTELTAVFTEMEEPDPAPSGRILIPHLQRATP